MQTDSFTKTGDSDVISGITEQACYIKESNTNTEEMNSPAKEFMDQVGLTRFYPQSLELMDAMKIKESMKCDKLEDIALVFIKHLVMLNYTCRDQKLLDLIEETKAGKGGQIKETTNSQGPEWESFLEVLEEDDEKLNPLDLLVAVFKCSNLMVKQVLANKLFMCKLAIPILFPSFGKESMKLSIWPLRSIILEDNTITSPCQKMSVDCVCEIVSFVRYGRPKQSKSRLVNEIIFDHQYHNTFSNKDCPLGSSTRKISGGLVEAAWYLPSANSSIFRNTTMFLNLRGEVNIHQEQLKILSKLSDVMVVIVELENLRKDDFEIILNLRSDVRIVLAIDGFGNKKKDLRTTLSAFKLQFQEISICVLSVDGDYIGKSTIKKVMRQTIADLATNSGSSLSKRLDKFRLIKDEDDAISSRNMDTALQIMKNIPEGTTSIKDTIVPLQGKPWCTWSQKQKAVNKSSQCQTLQAVGKIKLEMFKERQLQVQKCEQNQNPIMTTFIQTLSLLKSKDQECMSFILWLKLFLDERSRKVLPGYLAKFQSHWKTLKTARDTNEDEDIIKTLRQKLDESENQLAEASFGFEHLCREMGQIYEAVQACESAKTDLVCLAKRLPQIASHMLQLGQPFEIMDGDAANVPMVWIKAVLKCLRKSLGEKKLLALSVLGIQSSGKSTLLNTMFGLQFAVSAGRCTRGVFVQLVPVESKASKFDFVLVIDTEGLRAPELANQKHSHDNELATFVIGLGDVTIVNIKGENTAEMKDVLQIAVHAFLRLKLANEQLNLKQSCVFVHQNVPASDANDKMMQGRQKFVEILDEMTKEAADQENIADIQSFNQVIEFDSEKHVWYFSDLWTGDPPMAPANPGYSESVNTVKEAIMFQPTLIRETYLTISDTISRIEDLWNGILKDDFVFSFRNSLELKAYNSLEQECQEITWQLEKYVLEFLRCDAKSKFLNCERIDELENAVPDLLRLLSKGVDEKVETSNSQLDSFIEKNSLKDVMIQWTQHTRNRFNMTSATLVMKAKTDIIKTKEEIRIKKLRLSETTRHEREINERATKLALQMKGKRPSEKELEQTFDSLWNNWMKQFESEDIRDCISIKDQIESAICEKFQSIASFIRQNQGLLGPFHYTTKSKLEGAIEVADLFEEHFSIHKKLGGLFRGENASTCKDQAVDVANKIFKEIDVTLRKLSSQDIRFDISYVTDILNIVTREIDDHNKHEKKTYKFNLLGPFTALVISHVEGYAVVFFTEMNDKYNRKHSPKAQMEEYKGTAWVLFKNTFESRSGDAIAVGFFRAAIIKISEEHVKDILPIDVQESIRVLFSHGKCSLVKDILTRLAQSDDFSKYKSYIMDPRRHAEEWIMDLTYDKLFKEEHLGGITKYAALAKTRIRAIFSQIESSIISATSECKSQNKISLSAWKDAFLSHHYKSKTMPLSRDILVHVANEMDTTYLDFESMLIAELGDMEKKVNQQFENTTRTSVQWTIDPVSEIMINLWGCAELCMFCKEPCMNTNTEHVKEKHPHRCLQHRPQGIGGFKWKDSRKLTVDFCNHLVSGNCGYEMKEKTGPYKDYKKHFPDWDIPPNSDTSKYWMWVICQYKKELTKMYNTELPDIPSDWTFITKQVAIDSL